MSHSAEEYAKAFVIGYSLEDAAALLRLDGLYLESFLVTDIKHLKVQFISFIFFIFDLLRLDEPYLESFIVTDIKHLKVQRER